MKGTEDGQAGSVQVGGEGAVADAQGDQAAGDRLRTKVIGTTISETASATTALLGKQPWPASMHSCTLASVRRRHPAGPAQPGRLTGNGAEWSRSSARVSRRPQPAVSPYC